MICSAHRVVSVPRTVAAAAAATIVMAVSLTLLSCSSSGTEPEDTLGPTVALISPSADTTVADTSITIALSATDPSGVGSVTIGGQPATAVDSVYSAAVSLTAGVNTVEIIAADADDNANQTTLTVDVTYRDTRAPEIALVSTADTIVAFDSTATVRVTATDASGIAWVTIGGDTAALDDSLYRAAVTLQRGENLVPVVAQDSSADTNRAAMTVVVLYGDTLAPSIELTSPGDSSTVYKAAVDLMFTVDDPGGVAWVTLQNDTLEAVGTLYFGDADLALGENLLRIAAEDSSGNKRAMSVVLTYQDTTKPTIEVVSPANRTALFDSSVEVQVTVADANGIECVTIDGDTVAATDSVYTATVALSEGENVVAITARDASPDANRATADIRVAYVVSQTVAREITQDTTWSGVVELATPVTITNAALTIEPGTVVKFDTTRLYSVDTLQDGNVVYRTNKAGLAVSQSGAIAAAGVEGNPIRFTSAADVPAKGDWGEISLRRLTDDIRTTFTHCIIEYGGTGIRVGVYGDSLDWLEPTDLTVDHCLIRHMTGDGIYATNGGTLTVTNTGVLDCDRGLFLHALDTVSITSTFVREAGAGIVLPGANQADNHVTLEHVTIADIDETMLKSQTDRWWAGFGVYACNAAGDLTSINSILAGCSAYALSGGNWTVTRDYNCYHDNDGGSLPSGTLGDNSMEADPLFENRGGGDLRLGAGSPCIGAAGDSRNMGAWQSGALWWQGL